MRVEWFLRTDTYVMVNAADIYNKTIWFFAYPPPSLYQVSTEDLNKYNTLAQQQAKKLFPTLNMSKFYAAENADPLVFCHFADNIQDQTYDQVSIRSKELKPSRQYNQNHILKTSTQLLPIEYMP